MSQSSRTFSVIIPVHNKVNYLRGSIDSVLGQSWNDFELLLVDDASTDGSSDIIESYYDGRIQIIKRDQPGPGGYAARNEAIRLAQGDWICFLDADDRWLPDHLENKWRLILRFPTANLFTCRWLEERDDGDWTQMGVPADQLGEWISFDQYVHLCIERRRPVNTNVVTLRRHWTVERGLFFPAGKTDRTGDVGLWIRSALESGGMVTGAFFGAERMISPANRVSNSSEPNPHYFLELKRDVLSRLDDHQDKRFIQTHLDNLIGYTVKEAKRSGPGVSFVVKHLKAAHRAVFLKAIISQACPAKLSMAISRLLRWTRRVVS